MGSIKDRNGMDLTEAEDIKKRWQEYREQLYKKDLWVWKKGNPFTLLVGMQTSTATMRTGWIFLKKLLRKLPYDPAIPLLGIHTEETRSERDTCTPMFVAALFIIARTWKQPRCPSADEWIRKLWYTYIMEYSSAIKNNTFQSVLMR